MAAGLGSMDTEGLRAFGAARRSMGSGAGEFSIDMDMTGLRNLIELSPRMGDRVLAYTAQRTAARARINIREVDAIDTGFMVNTTRARRLGQYLWSIGTAAFYGVFIELGTVHMGARPWLMPAMYEGRALLGTLLEICLRQLPYGRIDIPGGSED